MKKYKFSINGNPYSVVIKKLSDDQAVVEVNGSEYNVDILEEPVQHKTPQLVRSRAVPDSESKQIKTKASARPATSGMIKAPLPGLVLAVMVNEGDEVKVGQTVVQMEAMKMENNVQSGRTGTVTSVNVKAGDSVLEGDVLVEIGG
ncbi:biotin/lipoyl-binding protein [candidate division KSB1 bacterium]|nr:biotin/lipoyl-binding protein [candidate division KSB1 bacterium]